jgi:hypothetical protein
MASPRVRIAPLSASAGVHSERLGTWLELGERSVLSPIPVRCLRVQMRRNFREGLEVRARCMPPATRSRVRCRTRACARSRCRAPRLLSQGVSHPIGWRRLRQQKVVDRCGNTAGVEQSQGPPTRRPYREPWPFRSRTCASGRGVPVMNLPLLQTSTRVSWHSSWQTYPSLDQQTENPSWSSRSASTSRLSLRA